MLSNVFCVVHGWQQVIGTYPSVMSPPQSENGRGVFTKMGISAVNVGRQPPMKQGGFADDLMFSRASVQRALRIPQPRHHTMERAAGLCAASGTAVACNAIMGSQHRRRSRRLAIQLIAKAPWFLRLTPVEGHERDRGGVAGTALGRAPREAKERTYPELLRWLQWAGRPAFEVAGRGTQRQRVSSAPRAFRCRARAAPMNPMATQPAANPASGIHPLFCCCPRFRTGLSPSSMTRVASAAASLRPEPLSSPLLCVALDLVWAVLRWARGTLGAKKSSLQNGLCIKYDSNGRLDFIDAALITKSCAQDSDAVCWNMCFLHPERG